MVGGANDFWAALRIGGGDGRANLWTGFEEGEEGMSCAYMLGRVGCAVNMRLADDHATGLEDESEYCGAGVDDAPLTERCHRRETADAPNQDPRLPACSSSLPLGPSAPSSRLHAR